MRFSPIVLLLFAMPGCTSGSQSVNKVDSQVQEQDVKSIDKGNESTSVVETFFTAREIESYGNVVRIEVVDEHSSFFSQFPDTTVVSGNATKGNQDFLNGLRDSALKTFPDGKWHLNGPEGSVRTIRLVCERGEIKLSSWHPFGGVGGPVAEREKFDEIERRLITRFKSP